LAICLALASVCCIVFGGVRHNGFINFDDPGYIYENPWVRSGLTGPGLVWAFTNIDQSYWHPLTWLSHMLDCQVFGLDAGWHHLVNLLLHTANAILVFLVFQQLTGARWRSAVLAALFALHPQRVESVAWAAERKDILSAFWFLLTLWLYQRHAIQPGRWRYLLLLITLALGLMSKPMLVTVPFLFLLLDWWPLKRRAFAEKLPMIPLVLISTLITYATIHRLGAVNWGAAVPLPHRIANALISYVRYLELTFWPQGLALPYPYRLVIPSWQIAGAALLLAGLTAGALWFGRRRPYLAVGWLWFIAGLTPAIGLVQVGRQGMADRFTYLPCLGLGLIVVWSTAEWLHSRPKLAVGLSMAAALGLAVVSWQQVTFWRDSVTLFSHTVAVTSENSTAERQLATALDDRGRLEDALPHYAAAVRIEPGFFVAQTGFGAALERHGETELAVEHLRAAVHYCPDCPDARLLLNQLEHYAPASDGGSPARINTRAAGQAPPNFQEARRP